MYTRLHKVKRSDGRIDEYVQILHSYREDGRIRQKIVANLGNKTMLQSQLRPLLKILSPDLFKRMDALRPTVSAPYGIMYLVHRLFGELNLWGELDSLSQSEGLADRVAVLVTNRFSGPTSEHGLGRWLETAYAIDRKGRRVLPRWKQQGRVKVDLDWLQPWYRTLDVLIEHKGEIEKALYLQLRDLFHLKVDVVFYDLTSAYFEGEGPAGLARYGHSRDGKPQNRQVLVGMVMANGFPISHHVFEGNLRDYRTVETVMDDLKKRFEVGRVIWVGDRGMITEEVVNAVKEKRQGYLMGLPRRRRPDVIRYIESVEGSGRECPAGIAASEKIPVPKTWVWEVTGTDGERVFVVHSEERQVYEQAMRERSMGRVKEELEGLRKRVVSGELKKREEIGCAAGKILSRNHGVRYYGWRLTPEGEFVYFEHPVHFEREKRIEGKYLIQTEEKNLDAVEAVGRYKELMEVERGFRSLKDVLDMRPIYHWKERRVKAHIFVAALAFLLERIVERRLKKAGSPFSAGEAINALQSVSAVEFQFGEIKKRSVLVGSSRARQVLKDLGIHRVDLPESADFDKKADVVAHGK